MPKLILITTDLKLIQNFYLCRWGNAVRMPKDLKLIQNFYLCRYNILNVIRII